MRLEVHHLGGREKFTPLPGRTSAVTTTCSNICRVSYGRAELRGQAIASDQREGSAETHALMLIVILTVKRSWTTLIVILTHAHSDPGIRSHFCS